MLFVSAVLMATPVITSTAPAHDAFGSRLVGNEYKEQFFLKTLTTHLVVLHF